MGDDTSSDQDPWPRDAAFGGFSDRQRQALALAPEDLYDIGTALRGHGRGRFLKRRRRRGEPPADKSHRTDQIRVDEADAFDVEGRLVALDDGARLVTHGR